MQQQPHASACCSYAARKLGLSNTSQRKHLCKVRRCNATACLGKFVCTAPSAKTGVLYTREAYRIRARTTPRITRRSCHIRQACVPHLVQAQFAVYATVVPHMCDDHTAHCAKKFVVLICSVSLARCWCSFSPGRAMYVLLVSRFVMQCRVLGDTSYSAPAPGILLRMV